MDSLPSEPPRKPEGRLLCMIIITKAMRSKSKKQFQYGVRIGVFSATVSAGLWSFLRIQGGESVSRLFQLLKAAYIPWLVGLHH